MTGSRIGERFNEGEQHTIVEHKMLVLCKVRDDKGIEWIPDTDAYPTGRDTPGSQLRGILIMRATSFGR